MHFIDNDRWGGSFAVDRNTRWLYTLEAWRDPWASWVGEVAKKRDAGQNVQSETLEGLEIAKTAAAHATGDEADILAKLLTRIEEEVPGSQPQLALMQEPGNAALIGRHAERENLSRYDRILEVTADRLAARFSAWYELIGAGKDLSGSIGHTGAVGDRGAACRSSTAVPFYAVYGNAGAIPA